MKIKIIITNAHVTGAGGQGVDLNSTQLEDLAESIEKTFQQTRFDVENKAVEIVGAEIDIQED